MEKKNIHRGSEGHGRTVQRQNARSIRLQRRKNNAGKGNHETARTNRTRPGVAAARQGGAAAVSTAPVPLRGRCAKR